MAVIDLTGDPHPHPGGAAVCVIAPYLALKVMIERGEQGNGGDIHLHPAGQGFWIARLLAQLNCRAVLCAPIGGECGAVLETLVPMWGVEFAPVHTATPTVCSIEDRRSGVPIELAREYRNAMRRHDVDQFFDGAFELALASQVTVITGRFSEECIPLSFYERLGQDLLATSVQTVGDFHGPELRAFLEHGRLSVLKISDQDLINDDMISEPTDGAVLVAIEEFGSFRIGWLVVSQAEQGAVIAIDGKVMKARPPILRAVDHRGSGDSMTAALAAALVLDLDGESAVRLACAAGAANVTRHGLGSASSGLIEQLSHHVRLGPVEVAV
jgi:1-phosphofructokinase